MCGTAVAKLAVSLTVAVKWRHVEPTVLFLNMALLLLACSRGNAVAIGTTNGTTQAQTAASSQGELKYKSLKVGWSNILPPVCAQRNTNCRELTAIPKTPTSFFIISGQGQGGSDRANIDRWIKIRCNSPTAAFPTKRPSPKRRPLTD